MLFFSLLFCFYCFQIRADGRTEPETYLPLLLSRLHFLDRDGVRRGVAEKIADSVPPETASASASASSDAAGMM